MKEDLLHFIFELQEQGMGVSTTMVLFKAAALSRDFQDKSRAAQYHSVKHFVTSHQLVHKMATHESQKDPRHVAAEAMDFMQNIQPKLLQPDRHQDFIINMDQTPVPFTYNSKHTLELVGCQTVHVRKSTSDTKRATFCNQS